MSATDWDGNHPLTVAVVLSSPTAFVLWTFVTAICRSLPHSLSFLFWYDNIIILYSMNCNVVPATQHRPFTLDHTSVTDSQDERRLFSKLYVKRLELKQPADTNKHGVIYSCHYKPSLIFSPPPRLQSMLSFHPQFVFFHFPSCFCHGGQLFLDWGVRAPQGERRKRRETENIIDPNPFFFSENAVDEMTYRVKKRGRISTGYKKVGRAG